MTQLAPQTSARTPSTIVEELARDVAEIRGDLHGGIGDRPYRLFLVVRTWKGGETGRLPAELTRTELGCGPGSGGVTGPKVTLGGSFSRTLRGVVPEGTILVEELAGTYIEADLVPFGRLGPTEEAWYEVTQDGRNGEAPDRPVLRCTLEGLPYRPGVALDWTMRLRTQEPGAPFGNAQLAADGGTP